MHCWLRPRLVIRTCSRLTSQTSSRSGTRVTARQRVEAVRKGSRGRGLSGSVRLRDGEENREGRICGGRKIVVCHNLFIENVIEFGGSWLEVETQPQSDTGLGCGTNLNVYCRLMASQDPIKIQISHYVCDSINKNSTVLVSTRECNFSTLQKVS